MIASQLINEHLSPLRTTDSVEAALAFMISQGVTELPLIEQKQLYNYVRLQQLSGLPKEQSLGDAIAKNPFTPSAQSNNHLYELVPMLAANELSLLAVTDAEGMFQGIIEQKSINKLISESLYLPRYGGDFGVADGRSGFCPIAVGTLDRGKRGEDVGDDDQPCRAGTTQDSCKTQHHGGAGDHGYVGASACEGGARIYGGGPRRKRFQGL